MEHRWGQRLPTMLQIWLNGSDDSSERGWLVNVSLSGGYIRTTARVAVMGHINVEADGPNTRNAEPRPGRLKGRVVRHGPGGLGVEWEEFASETLSQFVRIAACVRRYEIVPKPGSTPEAEFWTLLTPRAVSEAQGCNTP
jgi:hypothetical protein